MFGFKKDDVNAYIEKSAREHSAKVKALEEQIAELKTENKALADKSAATEEELTAAKAKVEYYSGKEAEIEKMSISIGTMYLVAKQSAAEVMANAEACAKEIAEHSKKQLLAASEVDQRLNALKEDLSGATQRFGDSVTDMSGSLEEIKTRLENQLANIENQKPDIELICGDSNL